VIPIQGFYHEDGTACQERVCLRPHPLWEYPWARAMSIADEDVTFPAAGEPNGLDTWEF
jgi:hypothetical protein